MTDAYIEKENTDYAVYSEWCELVEDKANISFDDWEEYNYFLENQLNDLSDFPPDIAAIILEFELSNYKLKETIKRLRTSLIAT